MEQVFAEAARELDALLARFAGRPRAAVVHLLLMALEREEIVSMAYRQALIGARLQRMPVPDDVRRLIEHAVIWIWKDEEMHAVYARGALMRLGNLWLRAQALAQQTGGILAGWSTSVLHHAGWSRAPLSRSLANLVTFGGRLAGKVPREIGRQLRLVSFREFCLLNAELEKASWMAWDRLALLAEQQSMMPEMLSDFHRVAEDEIRHLRVFEAIAAGLTSNDRLAPGEDADRLAGRIAEVGGHFLPYDRRGLAPEEQPIGSGGPVWALHAEPNEDDVAAFRRLLREAGLADAVRHHAARRGKSVADARVVIKTCFMLGYHRRDPSPLINPRLVGELVAFLRDAGCGDIVVAESRNLYDQFFQQRTVREVAAYFGLQESGYRLVDLSDEQQPYVYLRGLGQTTVASSWCDADFRISFGKVRSHPVEMALLSLGNLESVGGRSDQFLFAERQADRATALTMILDAFPPHFALLDCFANVPDGIVGMMGCARPRQPRRFYAGRDALAVDCVAARHLGMKHPSESSLLRTVSHWFGGWPAFKVIGRDEPIRDWRSPHGNELDALLSLAALPVYVWGSGRGSLFVPQMDPRAFPPAGAPGLLCRGVRSLVRGVLRLSLPRQS